ncbi:MAG: MerR family transcriptional regulator [Pedobacter sp.]|nr:MAG: MerR family transcriptional regulator [Pedobacter sp.]
MNYSISDLEQLSGIQSHTIRIWEQRYNALTPMRSEGNTRFYDDNQLVRLLNIVSLNQAGIKISKACSLSDTDLKKILDDEIQSIPSTVTFNYYVTTLIKYGLSYDEFSFDALLTRCIAEFGILEAYKNIMYPVLVRLGLMWRKDDICPAQEHFLSNIIRRKIFTAIDQLPIKEQSKESWLLFLPEDEGHDIGLMFAHYILKAHGYNVIFLGAKVPLGSIANVLNNVNVKNILFFMVRLRPLKDAQKYLNDLQKLCGQVNIHLAGNEQIINKLKTNSNINRFSSLEEFENVIKNHPVI